MDYLLALCLNALMVTVFTNDFVNITCFRISISFFVHLLQICKEAFLMQVLKTLLVLYMLPCAIEYKYNLVEITCIIASHVWTGIPRIYLSQSTEGKSLNFIPFIRNLCMSYKIFNAFVSSQSSFIAGIKPVVHQLYKSCCFFITFLHHVHLYRYTEEFHSNEKHSVDLFCPQLQTDLKCPVILGTIEGNVPFYNIHSHVLENMAPHIHNNMRIIQCMGFNLTMKYLVLRIAEEINVNI